VNSTIFQNIIKYQFNDIHLLETALTHSSCCSDMKNKGMENNEKLEFLGDAILDAIISEYLYKNQETKGEGILSKVRASIVCEKSLAEIGRKLRIGQYIQMGKGEELTGGRDRDSIVADAMEAVIGAIYLDRGYLPAQIFVLTYFQETIEEAMQGKRNKDYKTRLQEKLQIKGDIVIEYVLEKEEGFAHDKTFHMKLLVSGSEMGKGMGKNKKEAEQAAARDALGRGGKVVF